jgi:hypothetical protein
MKFGKFTASILLLTLAIGMLISISAATKQCEISVDNTPGFRDEYKLENYNAMHAGEEASDYLNHCLEDGFAEMFSAGYEVEVVDHDNWSKVTCIKVLYGKYWVNDGAITCEDF